MSLLFIVISFASRVSFLFVVKLSVSIVAFLFIVTSFVFNRCLFEYTLIITPKAVDPKSLYSLNFYSGYTCLKW